MFTWNTALASHHLNWIQICKEKNLFSGFPAQRKRTIKVQGHGMLEYSFCLKYVCGLCLSLTPF